MHINLLTLTRLLINSELLYFQPIYMVNLFKKKPLKCSINSCQLCTTQVSFSVRIFRCKNAVFHQRGERVFKFSQEYVWNAVGTRLERERTVRLFLSSTVFDKIIVQYILYSIMSFLHGVTDLSTSKIQNRETLVFNPLETGRF